MFTTLSPPARTVGEEGLRWAERIERALRGEGVRTVFQPIVDLGARAVVGYEALTRFDDRSGRYLGPEEWFAAAHEFGAGADLEATCLALALSHRPSLPAGCFLSLNVDPDALRSPRVRQLLERQGRLDGVVLEITEHRPWSWPTMAPAVAELRSEGARFAIDNAGTGQAGIRQLLDVRPDLLKLDRGLVDGIDTDEAKEALVEMVELFSRRIDACVLAEGVETHAEAACLASLGVPLAQGYLFGRPAEPWIDLPPTAFVDRATADVGRPPSARGATERRRANVSD